LLAEQLERERRAELRRLDPEGYQREREAERAGSVIHQHTSAQNVIGNAFTSQPQGLFPPLNLIHLSF
jgi:hypothetical protein